MKGSDIEHRTLACAASAMSVLLAVVGCATQPGGLDEGPIAVEEQPIWGGNEAWLDAAVAIKTSQCLSAPWHCGGVLISPTRVLTAAHCVGGPVQPAHPSGLDPNQATTFQVAMGCHDITGSCNWLSVSKIDVHDGNDLAAGTYVDDLAILTLTAPVSIKPLRLITPGRMSEVNVGSLLTFYGWGLVNDTDLSAVLRSADIPITAIGPKYIYAEWVPARGIHTGSGDSGGPALVTRDGEPFAVGIGSGGRDDSTLDMLMGSYIDWVRGLVPDLPAQSYLPAAQIMTAVW